ncbi:TPA: hypothetical protein NGR19_003740 [Vibrio parahaemolyticus]|nr:hypothetical protein [Vibrio parahaemolyticus]HCE1478373.1 hypothetical protein [Vibrio parahaemolyticus]HCH2838391.1 hypothetical protein [Vibrio parahaemolyticus]
MNVEKLAQAIEKANAGKQAFVGRTKDGRYLSWNGNLVKSRSRAMRLVNPKLFTEGVYAKYELEAVEVK